tara:strand:+ start:14 stop:1609 length:1596 start_codon:yes stop_codon:yes gene_type:complete
MIIRQLNKTTFLVISFVAIAIAALSWSMFKLQRQTTIEMRENLKQLHQEQLAQLDNSLQDLTANLVQHIQSQSLALINTNPEETVTNLRAFIRSEPLLLNFFVLDQYYILQFPDNKWLLTEQEQQFQHQIQRIDTMPELFIGKRSPQDEILSFKRQQVTTEHGWVHWRSSQEHLILWYKDNNSGRILGFELNQPYLLSRLMQKLDTASKTMDSLAARFSLTNDTDQLIHQWGNLELKSSPASTVDSQLSLPAPFEGWTLQYSSSALHSHYQKNRYSTLFNLAIIAGLLVLFGYFIYREQNRLRREAQQKVSFVNQVSHELKTPLTNIRLYTEMLKDSLEEDSRYLDVIHQETLRLGRLIENILNYARQQKNTLRVHRQPTDAAACIDQCIETFTPSLANKGIKIGCRHELSQPINIDPDILEQVVNNLLSNVEKYAVNGSEVQLTTRQENTSLPEGSSLIVRIQDDGPGIDPGLSEKIFTPFYRISNRLTDGVSGTGIGLSISRELCQRHAGSLKLIPTQQGACFEFKLTG